MYKVCCIPQKCAQSVHCAHFARTEHSLCTLKKKQAVPTARPCFFLTFTRIISVHTGLQKCAQGTRSTHKVCTKCVVSPKSVHKVCTEHTLRVLSTLCAHSTAGGRHGGDGYRTGARSRCTTPAPNQSSTLFQ